jgi:hypothetical protein
MLLLSLESSSRPDQAHYCPMQGPEWKDDDTISWRATPYRAPVLDTDGNKIGTAESLLGDESSDIFHGLAVKLSHGGRLVEISADEVRRITLSGIETRVEPGQVEGLPAYAEERWFHLGWGGLFRRHPDWEEG